ncbi:MAG: hypothetical protein WBG50_12015 [Desulfomonilaceae bacterium]
MTKRTIKAKEILADINAGMDDARLMDKYTITAKGLESVVAKLSAAGLLKDRKLGAGSHELSEAIPVPYPIGGPAGSIRHDAPVRPSNVVPMASQSDPMDDYADREPLEIRRLDKPEWIMLAVGPGIALVCFVFFWFRWTLEIFKTLVHEMGHCIFGWIFGYPSLPAFDVMYGGGVTLHTDRSTALLIGIYGALAALIYMYRKNTTTLIFLIAVIAVHAFFSYTSLHYITILFMGHGTELLIGGLFIYRSLSGRAIVHPAERPLYAITGFFFVLSDLGLAHGLLTSAAYRADYLGAKGGDMDMDFIRIARDYLNVDMTPVVLFFLVCCLLCPLLSFLAFRYEEYIHYAIARLWKREPENAANFVHV